MFKVLWKFFKYAFVANLPLSPQRKNFENRLTFDEVMGKSLVSCFLDSRCRSTRNSRSEISLAHSTVYGRRPVHLQHKQTTSCCSTDSDRPHRCCHLLNKDEVDNDNRTPDILHTL